MKIVDLSQFATVFYETKAEKWSENNKIYIKAFHKAFKTICTKELKQKKCKSMREWIIILKLKIFSNYHKITKLIVACFDWK